MKLRFVKKKHEASDIWSFWFEPVEPVSWIAGQSLRLEIPAGYDTDERRFTIASAPFEELIQVTTRLSGSVFKQGLEKLEPGTLVDAYSIEGNFIWGEDDKPRLFVAAGIGITPFRSMLLQRNYEDKSFNSRLIHAVRATDGVFQDEFADLAQKDDFEVEYLWDQRVAADYLLQIPNIEDYLIYISGPEKMVDITVTNLLKSEYLTLDNLKRDRFSGNIQF